MTRSVSLSRGSPEPRVTGQPPCLCAVLRASAGLGNSALAGPWKQARLDILQICRLGCLLNALEFFRSGTSCMAWVCRACKNNTWKPQHASESFDLMLPRQGKARQGGVSSLRMNHWRPFWSPPVPIPMMKEVTATCSTKPLLCQAIAIHPLLAPGRVMGWILLWEHMCCARTELGQHSIFWHVSSQRAGP